MLPKEYLLQDWRNWIALATSVTICVYNDCSQNYTLKSYYCLGTHSTLTRIMNEIYHRWPQDLLLFLYVHVRTNFRIPHSLPDNTSWNIYYPTLSPVLQCLIHITLRVFFQLVLQIPLKVLEVTVTKLYVDIVQY